MRAWQAAGLVVLLGLGVSMLVPFERVSLVYIATLFGAAFAWQLAKSA